jgi:hypothetical protein
VRSLRRLADCIGLKGDFDVVRDFFGYHTGAPGEVSLLKQMKLLRQYHTSINVILVGVEWFGEAERREIDAAIAFMRETYATVGFGVGHVRWYHITTDEANGREHILDDAEAEDLTHEWSVRNHAIDVFFVLTYAGSTIGSAPREGPSDKDANGAMTGVVLAIEGSTAVTGNVLAREVARYLGLKDSDSSNNLMYPSVPNGANLTPEQREDLMGPGRYLSPFVRFPCGANIVVRWA